MSVSFRLVPMLVASVAFAGPLAASAQTAPAPAPAASAAPGAVASPPAGMHHKHRHHRSMIHALNSVNLSDTQKQQIATFRDQEKTANLNADPATKEANAAKMRQQIMGVLSADQKTQLHSAMHAAGKSASGTAPLPSPAASPGMK